MRKLSADLGQQIKYLIDEVIQLVYFMRGGISYDELMDKTYVERQRFANYIDKRLENESKNPNPVY